MQNPPPLTAETLAAELLRIGAFKFSTEAPYQWASGWQSPVYCDNRLTLSHPTLRAQICAGLVEATQAHLPSTQAVAGVATAGIAQGALVADRLQLPFAYVRSKPKGHGMQNLIEGSLPALAPVLVVEDLVSTGKSSMAAIQALRQAQHQISGLVCIFHYGFSHATKLFAEHDVHICSLTNLEALILAGVHSGMLSDSQVAAIRAWQASPENWHA